VDCRCIACTVRDRLYLDAAIAGETIMMNLTGGVALICVAVAMIWFAAKPADGESHRFFKSAWIVGQLYVMTAMVLFVMGGAAIIANM
jgi:hypothetical protein